VFLVVAPPRSGAEKRSFHGLLCFVGHLESRPISVLGRRLLFGIRIVQRASDGSVLRYIALWLWHLPQFASIIPV